MSWDCWKEDGQIPPLASWVYYMVHPDVPQEFDGCALHDRLTNGDIERGGPFRYEFFFLPGATMEECHAHYLGEMKARGTIWRQIRKVNKAVKLKKEENGEEEEEEVNSDTEWFKENSKKRRKGYEMVVDSDPDQEYTELPGLVWPKHDGDVYFVFYRGWFFMYNDAETDCVGANAEKRIVTLVRFDPVPDLDEDGKVEPPISSRPIPVRGGSFDDTLGGWMFNRMRANWEEEANEATWNARKLGWTSW
ncbi:hypothetical protein FPOAC2_00228 [Fusarium poae]|uniref:hypothetical protein n=1 Tax=Fusarium poae TaxID=36050 RepID=UPI001CE9C1BD|nr:hypothetical protein FPOAC1_000204 [Fusarium poae]KAG8674240.1 hypothetical protein FPOAC1_000204 [Fusarium poae]